MACYKTIPQENCTMRVWLNFNPHVEKPNSIVLEGENGGLAPKLLELDLYMIAEVCLDSL